MRKVTVWEPDTCGCVIEIHWDTDDPAESRRHEYRQRVACPYHQGTDGGMRARADNQFKNIILSAAGESAGWHFTADRKLVVDLEKSNEQAARAEAAKHSGREVIFAVR